MQLKDLLKVIQKEFVVITVAYATTGVPVNAPVANPTNTFDNNNGQI